MSLFEAVSIDIEQVLQRVQRAVRFFSLHCLHSSIDSRVSCCRISEFSFTMSSESSLVTTAASDTSSSADSRYCSSRGGARGEATSKPGRRRSYNLKARGVVIAKATSSGGGNQKVLCSCKSCKGQRLVSKSTCYRHLRAEAEIAEDDVKPEAPGWNAYTQRETLRMYQFLHLAAGIRLGFVQ